MRGSAIETGEGFSPQTQTSRAERTPHPALRATFSHKGRRKSLRHQAERHPAKIERIARHLAALRLGCIPHLRDIGNLNVSPLIRSLAPLTKRKLALGNFSSASPPDFDGDARNPPPMLRQPQRIRALHLDPQSAPASHLS